MTPPGPARVEDLRAEARHALEKRDLYQAKMYGSRPTTMTRMRELERAYDGALDRLRRAEAAVAAGPPPDA